ncbi:MAG: peptide chain release factor 2 [Spirochaetota bacterium]
MEIKPIKELTRLAKEMSTTYQKRWQELNLQTDYDRMVSYTERSQDPKLWDKPEEALAVNKKKTELERKLTPWLEIKEEILDFPDLIELTVEEMGEEGTQSLNEDYSRLANKLEELELLGALNSPEDGRGAFFNIHPGAGGTESQDWADILLRMYLRYFEKKGFKADMVDYQPGDGAGIKNVTIFVQGELAFGYLKGENGIHRLVRISPFDSNKRRHTSFASVHVTPDIGEEIEVDINEKDLKIDTYRSSGAGGQHVNTTDSAVRITHMPTGIVVQCQNERSQIKNRATAMKMLKAKLYEVEREKSEEELEKKSGEKKDIAWGSQIRSYVFHPYNMIKDHRTEHETANVDPVMNGELEPFVLAYLKSL